MRKTTHNAKKQECYDIRTCEDWQPSQATFDIVASLFATHRNVELKSPLLLKGEEHLKTYTAFKNEHPQANAIASCNYGMVAFYEK